MSQTIRELASVPSVVPQHLFVVSSENTAFAFKTNINSIKDYILTSGGTIAVFSELNTPAIRTSNSTLPVYVNASVISLHFIGGGLSIDRFQGRTTDSTSIDLGSTIDFSISDTLVARIDSGSFLCDTISGYTSSSSYIELGTDIVFNVGGVPVFSVTSSGIKADVIEGTTVDTNKIDFNGTDSNLEIICNNLVSIYCKPTGEVFFPLRLVVRAHTSTNIGYIDTWQPLLFDTEDLDTQNIYNPATSEFTMPRAGMNVLFSLQVNFLGQSFTSADYVRISYRETTGIYGPARTQMYMQTATYSPTFQFTGVFVSTLTPDMYFQILATVNFTLMSSYMTMSILP